MTQSDYERAVREVEQLCDGTQARLDRGDAHSAQATAQVAQAKATLIVADLLNDLLSLELHKAGVTMTPAPKEARTKKAS